MKVLKRIFNPAIGLMMIWGGTASAAIISDVNFEGVSSGSLNATGVYAVQEAGGNSYLELKDNEFDFSNPIDTAFSSAVQAGAGDFELSFDFNAAIAPVSNTFDFPDMFQASVYLTNDINTFDIYDASTFEVIDLFSIDALGVATQNQDVQFGSSDLGESASISFESAYEYIVPYFTLFEFDYIAQNSLVSLDNIVLDKQEVSVNEPGTMGLMILGMMGLLRARKNKR